MLTPNYTAPKAEELQIKSEDILYDSNEAGWTPLGNDEEEE